MNHKLDTDTHVFFYEQEFYVLSNFSSFEVWWPFAEGLTGGKWHKTSEHLYHYLKFYPFECVEQVSIAQAICAAKSAHDAFAMAQRHKEYRHKNWDYVKFELMKQILIRKAQQHPYVMKKLLETGDRVLVEDSWRDDVWGWGPNKDGQNALGKLWMEVREGFRKGTIPKIVGLPL